MRREVSPERFPAPASARLSRIAVLAIVPSVAAALLSAAGAHAAVVPSPHATDEPDARTTAFVHVDVLDVADGSRLTDRTVIVEGERIARVGPGNLLDPPPGARLVDGRGKILMPGLCDMHVHVRHDPAEDFDLYLAHGVTTIRNMDAADGGWDHVALREKVRAGELPGPRYLIAGPFVDGDSAESMGQLLSLLREYETRRYDFIKVHGDLDPDIFDTLLSEADRLGIPVVGHAQRHRAPVVSLRMKSISHMEEFLYILPWSMVGDAAQHPGLASRLAARGVAVAPTLRIYGIIAEYLDEGALPHLAASPAAKYLPIEEREVWLSDRNEYRDPSGGYLRFAMSSFSTVDPDVARRLAAGKTRRRFEVMKSLTAAMQKAGVLLITGSDGFGLVVPGLSLHEELETLVEAGMTPLEALQASTLNVARYLGEEDRSGSVAEGMAADLLLLRADPTHDIENTRKIEGVMTRGRWLDRSALDSMLQSVLDRRGERAPARAPGAEGGAP